MQPGSRYAIIGNFFSIVNFQNTGAAFGILENFNMVLIFLTILIIGLLVYISYKEKYPLPKFFIYLIMVGALSNLLDRVFLGYVTDYIFFHFWPAFNVADMSITAGVIGLLIKKS